VPAGAAAEPAGGALSGAERRNLEKELASLDRRMARLTDLIRSQHDALAAHDQADYEGVAALAERLRAAEAERGDLELEWLETAERLEQA
jgi:hypothetical protein